MAHHPQKPGKIRVVFDPAVETDGVSLNKLLLSGPDLMNSLLGVLCCAFGKTQSRSLRTLSKCSIPFLSMRSTETSCNFFGSETMTLTTM